MKEKNKKLIAIILVVLVLGVCGFFAYKYLRNNSPKKIFFTSIAKTFNVNSNLDLNKYDTISTTFDLKVKLSTIMLDKNLIDLVNKLDMNGTIEMDNKAKSYYSKVITNYDNEELLEVSSYFKNSEFYIMIKDTLDKWIKLNLKDEDIDYSSISLNDIDLEQYEKAGKEIIDIMNNSLDSKYFTKKKNTVVLTIDKNNVKPILTSFYEGIKNSKEFKKLYNELTNNESNFDEDIDAVINELKDSDVSDFGEIIITETVSSSKKLEKLDITYNMDDEKYSFVIEKKDKNTIELSFNSQGIKMFSAKITTNESKEKISSTIVLSFMGVIDLRLDLNETIKYNLELEEIDVSNSIDSDKLTEEDLSKFEELMTNKGFTKLMEDFNKIDFENIVTSF